MCSKVEFTFEGLCPFFTKHLPQHRLMVGLIGVFEASEVMHVPTMAIFEEGFPEPVIYRGNTSRMLLTGDAFFHLRSNISLATGDIAPDASVKLLDVEGFYEPGTFAVDPQGCQARLHFSNGVISQIKSTLVKFVDKDGEVLDRPPEQLSYNLKLRIAVPEQSYGVLHFNGETDDFVFKAGRNYAVTVTSLPQSGNHNHSSHNHSNHDHPRNHFRYYYRIADTLPQEIVLPDEADPGDLGNPWCMIGGFDGTEY